ncbi:DUF1080 domain-containing protein [Telluribacter sp. SYSU D00476]|uniref:3-keto-disaccharide hydrolase n=1 Tax=Telluribacter sp. SYSU D00476 TaxID=2811430 RepID=UPI001FF3989B|nr:DUF1080 domain-containing protein [Telluribacter sp. SYSU D00476]
MITLITSLFLTGTALFVQTNAPVQSEPPSEWIWLFNGTGTSQWTSSGSDQFPERGWVVSDKILTVNGGGNKTHKAGDIITRKKYGDFDLQFEFKLAPGANTGLKYAVRKYPDGGLLGPEYQLIDDTGNKDIAQDKDDKRRTASLYEMIAPSARKLKPIGQWNTGRIVVKDNHVEHWLNGTKVVEYERGSKAFMEAKAASKFKSVEGYGMGEGHILLQDHGDEASFRNIRIREL